MTALILLDHGRDLDEGPQGPWLEPLCQRGKFSSVFQPVIQFEPKIWSTEKQAKTNNLGVPSDVASATRRRTHKALHCWLAVTTANFCRYH
jgi:hypothetical protein